MTIDQTSLYVAVMDTSCGTITIGLNAVASPVAVNNFVFLAQQKFYDGLDFTRVVKGFAIQGGSPDNSGNGGPGYSVVGELPTGQPPYPVGAFAMANSGTNLGTAGSQFFLVVTGQEATERSGADYAYVGQVTKGMKVVQKIDSFSLGRRGDGTPTNDREDQEGHDHDDAKPPVDDHDRGADHNGRAVTGLRRAGRRSRRRRRTRRLGLRGRTR